MKRIRVNAAEILRALHQVMNGAPIDEICRQLSVSEETLRQWQDEYQNLVTPEPRELRQLREENARLKGVLSDLNIQGARSRDAERPKR